MKLDQIFSSFDQDACRRRVPSPRYFQGQLIDGSDVIIKVQRPAYREQIRPISAS